MSEEASDVGALLGLSDRFTGRVAKALSVYAVTATAVGRLMRWYQSGKARITYTISIDSDDRVYEDVHEWLLNNVTPRRQRALVGKTSSSASASFEDEPRGRAGGELNFFYDGTRVQTVLLDGCRVSVCVQRPESGLKANSSGDIFFPAKTQTLVFTAYSEQGRDAVLGLLKRVTNEHYSPDRQPDLVMADRWGNGFERRSDLPARKLDTVVLRAGQKERLVGDIADFLNREQDYNRLGIPYHRGYLFYGPPGTGKTSVAKALANHFGLDLYYLPLTDVKADTSLLNLVASVRSRSMLLLEDIDVLHSATSREQDGSGLSLSGLLNALDGVGTPHGLLTVMTTNRLEVLDDALVRPGRVDVLEELGYLDDDQLQRLFALIGGGLLPELPSLEKREVAPAQAIEVMKRHLASPKDAVAELTERLAAVGARVC